MSASSANTLAKQLLSLPITLNEGKVHLWLTYRDLKPVSTFQLSGKKSEDKKVFDWLARAGLHYIPDLKGNHVYFASKDVELAEKAKEIMWKQNHKNQVAKGKLFGYPAKASELIAKFWKEPKSEIMTRRVQLLARGYPGYYRYAAYMLRKGYESEDGEVAKKWARIIRQEIPELAKAYEQDVKKAT